ncbi:MAG: hypothetical protein AUH69_11100 [Actinobacteria bacterium 13_1_40CM_4_65_12]|nr:MAG: hypothetical protein AUH69_11100 [Actinobacteria bacterium 13_1_40CM_4_65_12]
MTERLWPSCAGVVVLAACTSMPGSNSQASSSFDLFTGNQSIGQPTQAEVDSDGESILEEDTVANAGKAYRHKLEEQGATNEADVGSVTVVPVAGEAGFAADIAINVHHVLPNATYTVSRAPESFRPLHDDGICQRAAGLYPWEQPNSPGFAPAPAFLINKAADGTTIALTTDDHGRGSVSFHVSAPATPHGYTFDVMFRIFATSDVLLSDCFQVTAL